MTLVLDKLLPGQRVGASAWFELAKSILTEAELESFPNEPTVFRAKLKGNASWLILHADDGLLASTAAERARIIGVFGGRVTVQVGTPMAYVGDSFESLKRRYVRLEEGVAVYANGSTSRP